MLGYKSVEGPVRVGLEKRSGKPEETRRLFRYRAAAFGNPRRVIAEDLSHGASEKRYYCFGRVAGGVLKVRFTYRDEVIRIFGAGYWRKGKQIYERENQIHE